MYEFRDVENDHGRERGGNLGPVAGLAWQPDGRKSGWFSES
jgi:hypothetical protein